MDEALRFWSKVDIRGPDECWPWLASVTKRMGYGKFGRGGHDGGWVQAHRVAYELTNGPIPEGLHIMHSCDNPPCCNPRHLSAGTALDNIMDKVGKQRHRWGPVAGALNPNAQLTEEDVVAICALHHDGQSRADLARQFNVSWTQVNRIIKGTAWTEVERAVLAGRL